MAGLTFTLRLAIRGALLYHAGFRFHVKTASVPDSRSGSLPDAELKR